MIKKIILLLILSFCGFISWAQSLQVGHKQQTFVDASRENRNITAEIYYPATTAGDNVSIASGQFPVLVFGHGFVMVWSAYTPIWNAIVPNGYIMVFPTTETGVMPSHANFGKDIAYLVGALKAEGINASSTFFGAVANTSAVMGHSMGGGSAFLSVQYDSSITAIATLAAANTNPSAIAAAADISIPSILFAGSNDCVTPPIDHQLPMYNALSSPCKTYVNIMGASHCQFASTNLFCNIGEGTCTPKPVITPAAQQNITFEFLLPWLNYYLKNDNDAGVKFQILIAAGNGITAQQNCLLATANINEVVSQSAVSIFPNPFTYTSTLQTDTPLTNGTIYIYNIYGQSMAVLYNIKGQTVELSRDKIASGIYYIQLMEGDKIIAINKIVISD